MRCDKIGCDKRFKGYCMQDTQTSLTNCTDRAISILHPDASDASGLMPEKNCKECVAYVVCWESSIMMDDERCNTFYNQLAKFIDKKIMEVLK